jgi:HSP20 family protein
MSMQRWEPFRELMSLREAMDRLFEESFVRPGGLLGMRGESALAMDMYQTADDVVCKVALPGVRPEDVQLTISGDTLTIRAEIKPDPNIKQEDYLLQERRYGPVSRTVTLPVPVQADRAEATFENGILTIRLPKAEQVKPRQIRIQVAGQVH